jgi:hypothetical protein
MRNIAILFGTSLIIILISGNKTEVYGQQCCTNGQPATQHYYLQYNGWCQLSSSPDCGSDECSPCNYNDFMQCLSYGDSWNPYGCSCIPNCSDNSVRAQNCYSQPGWYWNSATCSCHYDPFYNVDPCDYTYSVYGGGGYYEEGPYCVDCNLAYYGWTSYSIEYWYSSLNNQYCYSTTITSGQGGYYYSDECIFYCFGWC